MVVICQSPVTHCPSCIATILEGLLHWPTKHLEIVLVNLLKETAIIWL